MRQLRPDRRSGRIVWSRRGSAEGGSNGSGDEGTREHEGQRRALDWGAALARLGPVRRRWDLAILCNLDEAKGQRPADLLPAINSQAGPGLRLSPQVLSGRLRVLERDGYIRHVDESVMPTRRVYYLEQPGRALISYLSRIIGPGGAAPCAVGATGKPQ